MNSEKTQKSVHVENLREQLNEVASNYLSDIDMSSEDLRSSLDKAVVEFIKNEVRAQVESNGSSTPLADFFKDVETFEDLQKGIESARGQLSKDTEAQKVLESLDGLAGSCEGISGTISDLSDKIKDIKGKENFSWGENVARFAGNIVLRAIPEILTGAVSLIVAAWMLASSAAIYAATIASATIMGAVLGGSVAGPAGLSVGAAVGALGAAGAGGVLAYESNLGPDILLFGKKGAESFVDGINTFCKQFKIDSLGKAKNDKINMVEVKVALEKFIEETIQPQLLTDVANKIQASAKAMEASVGK